MINSPIFLHYLLVFPQHWIVHLLEVYAVEVLAVDFAYQKHEPCGWCSVAPREQFKSLERSRVLKRLDEEPVWSLVCFFIQKHYRGQGLGEKLIRGAVEFVKSQGGHIIEAYPTPPREKKLPPVSSFMGIPKIFERVGFQEVHRPSSRKIIMRYYITP